MPFDKKSHYYVEGRKKELCLEKHSVRLPEEENNYAWRNFHVSIREEKEKKEKKVSYIVSEKIMAVKTIQWQTSQEQSILCHYLLHRIFISNRKGRGRYINFDNLFNLMKGYFTNQEQNNPALLYKKILAMMCYYQRIGIVRFVGYVKNYEFKDKWGNVSKGTAYFKIKHAPILEYWHDKENCHFSADDILLSWVKESAKDCNKMVCVDKGGYSKDTLSNIGKISIGDLTGIRMLYNRK